MSSNVAALAQCAARLVRYGATLAIAPAIARAQTDYFNLDRGRPLHVQDAVAIERYALELQAAPVHWSRGRSGRDVWTVEPELSWGMMPRTQLGLGVAVIHVPGVNGLRQINQTSLHLSALHALNVESLTLPAFALSAGLDVPFGTFATPRTYPSVGIALTRTTSIGRLHANADLGLAESELAAPDDCGPQDPLAPHDQSRWVVGVAVDRALALRSMLVAAEVLVRRPVIANSDVEWRAAGGVRWQLDPRWSLNAGIGRAFGFAREWSVTFGAARSIGLVRLMPGGQR